MVNNHRTFVENIDERNRKTQVCFEKGFTKDQLLSIVQRGNRVHVPQRDLI